MNTLYQRTVEKFDIAGNSLGWETQPVTFPDTFFLYSGLRFNWTDNTVTRNNKTYYLDKLVVNQEMDIPKTDEWLSHYGNDIQFVYYTGDASETEMNPSGNIKNIRQAIYLSSGIVKYILEFQYNERDQVIKQMSKAPADTVGSGNEQQQEEQIIDNTEQDLSALRFAIGKEMIATPQNSAVIRDNVKVVLVTRRRTSSPLITDALQVTQNVGKITISVSSSSYNVQAIAFTANNRVLYSSPTVQAVAGTPTTLQILNNYNENIDYIAINLYYNVEESTIDESAVTQSDLGVVVTFIESVNLVVRSEGSEDSIRHLYVGDTVLYSSLPTPIRSGYEFDGWKIGNNAIASDFVITGSTVIEAVWTRLYTLTLVNGEAQSTLTYRDGATVTLDSPTKVGHNFVGWYADGSSSAHEDTFVIAEDITLTAMFLPIKYTLTLVNGEDSTPTEYDYGTSVELTTPEKENYTFVGWFAEGAETPTASPLTITENITLTARFEIIQYTVTLINVDGRGLNTEDTITCDSGHSLTENEVKAKLDESLNTFSGCYTDSEMTQSVTFPYTVSGNVTLYCKFSEIGG